MIYFTVNALGLVPGMVLVGTSPRACTVEYALVFICSEKTESVLENTLDKGRSTGTFKTMCIAFRSWIMCRTTGAAAGVSSVQCV